MASRLTRNLIKPSQNRAFSSISQPLASAQVATASASHAEPVEPPKSYIKQLGNGLTIGAIESHSTGVARLAIVAKAGSRYENGSNLGVSHILRRASQFRTANRSALGLTRSSLQLGCDITAETTREFMVYKTNAKRNLIKEIGVILGALSTQHSFKPWEMEDVQADPMNFKLDLAVLKNQPHVRAVDLLHAAAFRDTLGRSLYAPDHMIGKYDADTVQKFAEAHFAQGRLALVGVGVDGDLLEAVGNEFVLYNGGDVAETPASYRGGEIRDNTGGEFAHVAVAANGPGKGSKHLLAAEVLQCALGCGPHIKYSEGIAQNPLAIAAAKAAKGPTAVSSFSANYSDGGLLGFTAVAHHSDAHEVVKAVAGAMKDVLSKGLSDKDVAKAKNQLKAKLSMDLERSDVLLDWLAEQALCSDAILSPADVIKMVDSISTTEVNDVAKAVIASKLSMGAAGNVTDVPYLDEL